MKKVLIQIPTIEAEQNIEIDVKINGKRKTLRYKIEIIDWESDEPTSEEKIEILRKCIREYDRNWKLIQIGAPIDDTIPIMFQQKMVEVEMEES